MSTQCADAGVAITASGGQQFLVSSQDAAWVESLTWFIDSKGYANNKNRRLHRLICDPRPGEYVDHINRNKLDNRRENLRCVPPRVNVRNHGLWATNKTGHTGVVADPNGRHWIVYIAVHHRTRYIGRFGTIAAAVAARKEAETRLWGDER